MLAVLVTVIVALFAATLLFALYAVLVRLEHQRREARDRRLTKRWRDGLLRALVEPAAVAELHEVVEGRYRRHFVNFVLEHSRRVRGEEKETLRRIALPYLPLIADRAKHRDPEVRTRAIQTLGTLGLPSYSETLLEALDDPSPLVSMVAARYMARQDYPQLAGPILDHLERFEGWNRRFLSSMLASMGPEVSPLLRDVLGDRERDPWVRAAAADALLMQLDPKAGDVAVEVLEHEDDRALLAAVLALLAVIGRPDHATAVRARADAPDDLIRARALHALGVVGGRDALPLLLRGTHDDAPWVALAAARGLKEAGGLEELTVAARGDGRRAAVAGQVLAEGRRS